MPVRFLTIQLILPFRLFLYCPYKLVQFTRQVRFHFDLILLRGADVLFWKRPSVSACGTASFLGSRLGRCFCGVAAKVPTGNPQPRNRGRLNASPLPARVQKRNIKATAPFLRGRNQKGREAFPRDLYSQFFILHSQFIRAEHTSPLRKRSPRANS